MLIAVPDPVRVSRGSIPAREESGAGPAVPHDRPHPGRPARGAEDARPRSPVVPPYRSGPGTGGRGDPAADGDALPLAARRPADGDGVEARDGRAAPRRAVGLPRRADGPG